MADRFFSVPKIGANKFADVVEAGSAQAGNPIEVRITYDAAGMKKIHVDQALEAIRSAISKDTWPPV